MSVSTRGKALAVACCALGVSLQAHSAHAADCSTLPTPVYITGSSAVKPFLAALGKALAGATPPTTLVYLSQGSCKGADAIVNSTAITGTASIWDGTTGVASTCALPLAGQAVDVGVSDVFAKSCGYDAPATVGDFFGPNQVMEMVVPIGSNQNSISAQAAYFVFGFGAAGQVAPWTDDNFVFVRSATSGTQQMITRAISTSTAVLPAEKWTKGQSKAGSADVAAAVAASTEPQKTIGILAADVIDAQRATMRPLAFKSFDQTCSYYPDSTENDYDKANVRDGHYPIWGPLHLFAKVDANKAPTSAAAAKLIGYFTGTVAPPTGVNILDLEIDSHTVPACAMRVSRTEEVGPLASFAPEKSCGCYFEKRANSKTSCTACTDDTQCTGAAKHCNYGFCEAK